MTKSQELVVRSSSDVAQLDELEAILLREKEPPTIVDDPDEISREIMLRLLSAETDAELESFGSAVGWRDLMGVPIEIKGFTWRPSKYDGEDSEGATGPAVFFVVQGTRLDTGEPVVLTTGSGNVLAQLVNMAKRRTLVGAVRMIEEGSKTTRGFNPLWLVTPPQPRLEALKAAREKAAA